MRKLIVAISRQKKEQTVQNLTKAFKESKVVIFTDFRGMDVSTLTELRNHIRETGGKYLVAKKTLIKKALEDNKLEGVNPLEMEGQIGLAFGNTDPAATSKVIYQLQKTKKVPQILSGFMDGNVLTSDTIIQLATLPPRQELLAKFVGSIHAPIRGFVNVLDGTMRGLVYALHAIKEQKS